MKYIDADRLKAEIERRKEENNKGSNLISRIKEDEDDMILFLIDSLPDEQPSKDLEEAYRKWVESHNDGDVLYCKKAFIAGAEWGEKNAYKTIMKKADEVRDKMFDTDYEVKIDPAAGFDFGCVNVYHEGKLVGQYVEPKKEKKSPEGLDEAAVQAHIRLEESEKLSFFNVFKAALQARIRLEESDELSFFNLFKAGAEWMAKQMPMPEDAVIFQKGVAEGKRLMMEDAVEGKVAERVQGKLYARCQVPKTMGFEFGDKVKIIIVKEDKK